MSPRSVADKLLLKPGMTLWLSHPDRQPLLGPLPDGVRRVDDFATAAVAVLFADDEAGLRALVEAHRDELGTPSALWVLYPKGNRTDLNRDSLWPILAVHGVRPITQVAVDEVWSALRFRPLRPDEPPFTAGG